LTETSGATPRKKKPRRSCSWELTAGEEGRATTDALGGGWRIRRHRRGRRGGGGGTVPGALPYHQLAQHCQQRFP